MKTLLKIILLVILIKVGIDLIRYVYGDTYLYCLLYDFWIFICSMPIVGDVIDHFYYGEYTVSELLTIAVILLGILYILIHLIEIVIKGFAALVGRPHEPFRSKHHVKKLFLSAIFVKIILLAAKVAIVISQAWGISQFFHWVWGDPVSVYHIIKNDAMFFIVLLIVLAVSLFKSPSQPRQQLDDFYYRERNARI